LNESLCGSFNLVTVAVPVSVVLHLMEFIPTKLELLTLTLTPTLGELQSNSFNLCAVAEHSVSL